MTTEILHEFNQRGILLYRAGAQLRYRAKRGTLTPADKARIQANKPAILEALKPPLPDKATLVEPPAGTVPVDAAGLPFRPCHCGSRHFWEDAGVWRCSSCCPMPAGVFLGETVTVSRQAREPSLPVTMATSSTPLVRCGECRHFERDTIGDGSGIGTCALGIVPPLREPAMFPNARRNCDEFEEGRP